MMAEYVLIFFGLMIVLVGLFSLYKRYFKAPQRKESDLYINALQDLLDSKQETAFSKLRHTFAWDRFYVRTTNPSKPCRCIRI